MVIAPSQRCFLETNIRFRAENNRAGEALAKNVFRRVLGIP
jgi:hypothetical protein